MNRMKRRRLYYLLSAILLFCFSGTFLLMPVAGRADRENVRAALGTVGVLFWLTGIGGYTLLVLARRLDAGSERAERKAGNKKRENTKPDFPVGRAAVALDIVVAAGVVTLLVWSGKWFMQRYGAYVVLFITTMAFHARLLIGSRPGRGSKSLQGEQKANQDGKAAAQGKRRPIRMERQLTREKRRPVRMERRLTREKGRLVRMERKRISAGKKLTGM